MSDVRERHIPTPEMVGDSLDGMCPNCCTPWKCNGPHEPRYKLSGRDVCVFCHDAWPCDAIQQADRADAALTAAGRLAKQYTAARADADRLAAALYASAVAHHVVLATESMQAVLATEPMQAIARVVHEAVEQVDEWHGDEVHDGHCERPLCVAVLRLRGNDPEAPTDE